MDVNAEKIKNALVKSENVDIDIFKRMEIEKNRIASNLPTGMDVNSFLITAKKAIKNNYILKDKTDPYTIFAAITGAGQLELSFAPQLRQAHIVPFYNTKRGMYEAVLVIGVGGMLSLAYRGGMLTGLTHHIHYDNDYFDMEFGNEEYIKHKPYFLLDQKEKGNIKGAYCILRLATGERLPYYMTIEQIHEIRDNSPSWRNEKSRKNSCWMTYPEEMIIKTVIKHSLKNKLPLATEKAREMMRKIETTDETIKHEIEPNMDMIDGDFVEIETEEFDAKMQEEFNFNE
jgi:recombination protein RecT